MLSLHAAPRATSPGRARRAATDSPRIGLAIAGGGPIGGMYELGALRALEDAIELGALTQAFDLRMAERLQGIAPRRRALDMDLYARAYRDCGLPRLRARQIVLIAEVGNGLARALRMPGVATLLRLSRVPARAAGLSELQAFLERGFDAFAALGDAARFVEEIRREETRFSRELFFGDAGW
jgi:hypothetical protein